MSWMKTRARHIRSQARSRSLGRCFLLSGRLQRPAGAEKSSGALASRVCKVKDGVEPRELCPVLSLLSSFSVESHKSRDFDDSVRTSFAGHSRWQAWPAAAAALPGSHRCPRSLSRGSFPRCSFGHCSRSSTARLLPSDPVHRIRRSPMLSSSAHSSSTPSFQPTPACRSTFTTCSAYLSRQAHPERATMPGRRPSFARDTYLSSGFTIRTSSVAQKKHRSTSADCKRQMRC